MRRRNYHLDVQVGPGTGGVGVGVDVGASVSLGHRTRKLGNSTDYRRLKTTQRCNASLERAVHLLGGLASPD